MTITRRRLYLTGLALLFFAIVPILLGLATGYRFDFRDRRLVLTGSLTVDSDPRGATIELNGAAVADRTPARLTGILPGDYTVRISKTGYHPFEKRVSIVGRQAVTIEPLTLFRNEQPIRLEGLPPAVGLSPHGRYAIASRKDGSVTTVEFIDVDQGERTLVPVPSGDVVEVSWSPDESRATIILGGENRREVLLLTVDRPASPVRLDQTNLELRRTIVTDDSVYLLDASGTFARIGANLERSVLGTGVEGAASVDGRNVITIETDGLVKQYTDDAATALGRVTPTGSLVEGGGRIVVLTDDAIRETTAFILNDSQLRERAKIPAAIAAVRANEEGDALLLSTVDASLLERRGNDRLLFRSTDRVVDAAWLDRQNVVLLLADSLLAFDVTQTQPTALLKGVNATDVRAYPDGRRLVLRLTDGSLAILTVR